MDKKLKELLEAINTFWSKPLASLLNHMAEIEKRVEFLAKKEIPIEGSSESPEKKAESEELDFIRKLIRASRGESIEETDVFSGLINIKDIREKTRLSQRDIYSHTYMRSLGKIGAEEWSSMNDWAEMEDHYFISEEGESRKEAILMKMQTALSTMNIGQNVPLSLPQVQTKPTPEEGKKGDKK